MQKYIKLWLSIIFCLLAGAVGSLFTNPAIQNWYTTINKPSFNPPNWIFGPVWTILFILMGISLFLVWRKGLKKKDNKLFFVVFIIHLFVNACWSLMFFGLGSPLAGFINIIILWIMILFLFWKSHHIDIRASWLLLPYLLWVSFATVLNASIWQLN